MLGVFQQNLKLQQQKQKLSLNCLTYSAGDKQSSRRREQSHQRNNTTDNENTTERQTMTLTDKYNRERWDDDVCDFATSKGMLHHLCWSCLCSTPPLQTNTTHHLADFMAGQSGTRASLYRALKTAT